MRKVTVEIDDNEPLVFELHDQFFELSINRDVWNEDDHLYASKIRHFSLTGILVDEGENHCSNQKVINDE